jgi:hypothetical protein
MSLRKGFISTTVGDNRTPIEKYLAFVNYTNTDMVDLMTTYYNDLVSNNLFDKLEYCYPFAADASGNQPEILRQNSYNLANARKYKLSYVNSPTADLIGVQWSSANQSYANTGFIPSINAVKTTLSNACAGAYQTTNAGNSADYGSNGTIGTNASFAMSANLGVDIYAAINGVIASNTVPVNSIGMVTMIREGSLASFRVRRNGAEVYNLAFGAATQFCDLPMLIGALGPTSNNIWSNNKICHHFMANFTAAELVTYETLTNALQGDIETALGLTAGDRKKY